MKLLVINNIASGLGEGAIYDFIRAFTQNGDQIAIRSTDGTTDIASLLHDAHAFDIVVASGGDGTVAAVCYELRNTGIPVLPFPAGTANLLALNINSPFETHALSKMARDPKMLDFDMGEIIVDGKAFGFNLIAGAGYDCTIMRSAAAKKRLLGPLAYFSAALAHPTPQTSHFVLDIDDTHIETDGVGILLANFSKIQFDLEVTHKNNPRDGLLDVVILKANTTLDFIPSVLAAALDRNGDFPDRGDALEIHSGRSVRVSADPALEVQFDGEFTGLHTPFTARVINKANRLLLSSDSYDYFSSVEDGGQEN